jgi:hypothetical protein
MQHRLKPMARTARTWIIPTQLFDQFLVSVHDAVASLDLGLRRETFATLARYLKTSAD